MTRDNARALQERAKVPKARPGRPGGRRDTNRKERTQALVDAALQLFLERGVEAVAIEDITQAAGVAKGSFYRYFDDKTALVESLFAPIELEIRTTFEAASAKLKVAEGKKDAGFAYEGLARGMIDLVFRHPMIARLYLQENRAPATGARAPIGKLARLIGDYAIEQTQMAQKHGILRPFPPIISMMAVTGAAERLLFAVLASEDLGQNVEPLEVANTFIGLVLDGLRERGKKAA